MQQQLKFIIPQKIEDLLHPQEDPNIFYVNDELTALEINQKLPESEQILRDDPLAIAQEFNTFYSVVKNFNELDSRNVDRAWTLIFKVTNSFKEQLREIFSVLNESVNEMFDRSQNLNGTQNSISQQENRANFFESIHEKVRYSNALKMLVFLNCALIQQFEDALSSQQHRQNFNETYVEGATPAARRRKKQRLNNDSNRDVSFKEYDRYKERVLKNLLQLILVPLNKIADSSTEAKEIAGQVMRASYKMIENSAINNLTRSKDLLDINFSILGCGIEKFNQSLSFCLKFIQLLQYREQLAPILSELVAFIVARHEQRLLIGELLREIDRIDIRDLSRDSSCPRAISTFLVTLSEKCPKDFIPSLNHIFAYLEQDSYIMRNASLSVMANLVIKHLHGKEEEKGLRDELLDALLDHVKDTIGYTRSRALVVWSQLCENESIPLTYVVRVTEAAVKRLSDKSCFVRKSAVRFLISILSRNPFAGRLPLQAFMASYETEKATLEKMIQEEKEKLDREEEVLETLSQSSQASITEDTDPTSIHPNFSMKNVALAEESAVVTQKRKVNYLQDAIAFTKQIHRAIPLTVELLTSKNITDIQEAIDFFVHCHEFGIDEALVGFKRMILLINVQEKSVKDAISAAYKRIFFESARYEGKANKESLIITNFINFVQNASIGECLALEILIAQIVASGDFSKELEAELWARFTGAKRSTGTEDAIAAIQILGMLASCQPDVIKHNLQLCVQHGLSSNGCGEQESRLVRETCIAIRKSLPRKIEDKQRRPLRLAKDDEIFTRLETILVESLTNLDGEHWFSMCDEAMRIIFDMAESPDKIGETIFNRLSEELLKNSVQGNSSENHRNESPDYVFQPSSIQTTTTTTTTNSNSGTGSQNFHNTELVHPIALARFTHFLGDLALDLAVFLELHVLLELKLRNISMNDQDHNKTNISAHNISISSRRRSRRYGGGGGANKSIDDQNLEEEIGLGGAEAEDAEMEFIGSICDEEIVCGKNLLAKLSRIIIEIAVDPLRYVDIELKLASSLALAKFMMVSAKFCNNHLRLLFTILEKSKESEIKINLLVAISDLCIRFPNQLDGWTGKIFDCLQSDDVAVRRAALKIISRLVLCDILKAKDQISTMANLIVDSDDQIASYSRHFFLELSKKLNAIYNVLPDIISRLSDSKTGINEADFRIVMKFMFELIDKSHHIDRLVDKLCGRFMDTDDERHWSDLAHCLSLLKYSDKSMVKLFDKFDCYKDKLCIDSVKESISSTIVNYRKTPHLKNEIKQMLDEFEAKIAKCVGEETPADENEEANGEQQQPQPQDGGDEDVTFVEDSEMTNGQASKENDDADDTE